MDKEQVKLFIVAFGATPTNACFSLDEAIQKATKELQKGHQRQAFVFGLEKVLVTKKEVLAQNPVLREPTLSELDPGLKNPDEEEEFEEYNPVEENFVVNDGR